MPKASIGPLEKLTEIKFLSDDLIRISTEKFNQVRFYFVMHASHPKNLLKNLDPQNEFFNNQGFTSETENSTNKKYHHSAQNDFLFRTSDLLIKKFIANYKPQSQPITELGETHSEILKDKNSEPSVDSIFGAEDDSFDFGDSDSDDLLGDLTASKPHVVSQPAKTQQQQVDPAEFNFDDFEDDFATGNQTIMTETNVGPKSDHTEKKFDSIFDNDNQNLGNQEKIENTVLLKDFDEKIFLDQVIQNLIRILENLGRDDWFLLGEKCVDVESENFEILRKTFCDDADLEFVKITEEMVVFYSKDLEISFSFEIDQISRNTEKNLSKSKFLDIRVFYLKFKLFGYFLILI